MSRVAKRGLDILAGAAQPATEVSLWYWATVTDDSPLRIKLDGESTALAITPDTLVASLAVSDRVWVQLITNTNPARRYRRAIIIGRSGG